MTDFIAALPTVATPVDCASFSKTVAPYFHQLSLSHLLPLLRGEIAPKEWYLATNPAITAILFALFISLVVFVSAEINRNFSQVDRLWSILPAVYTGHFALWSHLHGIESERVDTLAMLVALWSARLTFNYWRKGGYQIGAEDYRWEVLRERIPAGIVWTIFDLGFVALFQNLVLVGITMPAYVLMLTSRLPDATAGNDFIDTIFSRGLVIVLLIETLADQQQWAFQQAKKSYKETGKVPEKFLKEDLDRGFVVSGLWSFCRHPNFLCEQTIWFGIYQWACFRTDTMFNWSGLGAVAYWGIFQASTNFTESISAGKYPEYREYQALVNKFVPGLKALKGRDDEKPVKKE
ncbi:hypothetical protein FN846DRAFT_975146 [Sphaerosporella brunnea]|uniref:DUF1295 domain protein n=1 Tax=Sphaerosporella brunnea TaxID=1250544 RepID=A0A5J5EGQ5_9PEZI|nr:hypothetical protein FN846DRAFT_975146 [Sphaerosporella brunnea]